MKVDEVQEAAAEYLEDKVVQRLREPMCALPDTRPLMLQDSCWLQAPPLTLPLMDNIISVRSLHEQTVQAHCAWS
jgi:hypothetical protein